MEFYDLLDVINSDYCIEVYEIDGYLLQDGVRGLVMWEDHLLDRRVHMIYPHNETIRIFLEKE